MNRQTTGSSPIPRPVPFAVRRSTGSRSPSLRGPEPVRPVPASGSPNPTDAHAHHDQEGTPMTNTPSTQPAKQDPMHPTLDAGNVRGVGRAQEGRPELHRLYRFWVSAESSGTDVDQEFEGWWSGRNWHALYDLGIWDPEFVMRWAVLADEERAAVVAELEQARAEVERQAVLLRAIKDCHDDPARAILQADVLAGGAIIRAHAAEAREVALRERIDNLIDGEGKLHKTWRNELEMVVAVDLLRAALAADPSGTGSPRIEETCCGKCPGGTCYVDQVTGA